MGGEVEPHRRPPAVERWADGFRTAPVRVTVRTEWKYSEPAAGSVLPEGRSWWPFYRGGRVTASDVPSSVPHLQDIASHLHRAIEAFGDDKDLVVEVRLVGPDQVGTVDELTALPVGTVVRSAAGTIACRYDELQGVVFGDERPFAWSALALPATVLHREGGA